MRRPSAVPTASFAVAVVLACASLAGNDSARASGRDPLLAIDQNRASVIERIVAAWGTPLAQSSAVISLDDLRPLLEGLRADHLLAASLAGTLDGVRDVLANAMVASSTTKPALRPTKALGDRTIDDVYTPVTPCRLVETRGAFAAVYQGNGTPSHNPVPFASNEIRTYTVQGGNGVCVSQLPLGLAPSAVQLQVFGMPTSSASGDVEILPQGTTFGTTATMVYVGSLAFNTVSTTARINPANNQISVQVRGGGAHLAIDVVGYFKRPGNYVDAHVVSGIGATMAAARTTPRAAISAPSPAAPATSPAARSPPSPAAMAILPAAATAWRRGGRRMPIKTSASSSPTGHPIRVPPRTASTPRTSPASS